MRECVFVAAAMALRSPLLRLASTLRLSGTPFLNRFSTAGKLHKHTHTHDPLVLFSSFSSQSLCTFTGSFVLLLRLIDRRPIPSCDRSHGFRLPRDFYFIIIYWFDCPCPDVLWLTHDRVSIVFVFGPVLSCSVFWRMCLFPDFECCKTSFFHGSDRE